MGQFAILVTSREVLDYQKKVFTADGTKFWLVTEEGWVVGIRQVPGNQMGLKLKTFPTMESATKFAKTWSGNPWWISKKSFEVIEVSPTFETIQTGWEMCVKGAD